MTNLNNLKHTSEIYIVVIWHSPGDNSIIVYNNLEDLRDEVFSMLDNYYQNCEHYFSNYDDDEYDPDDEKDDDDEYKPKDDDDDEKDDDDDEKDEYDPNDSSYKYKNSSDFKNALKSFDISKIMNEVSELSGNLGDDDYWANIIVVNNKLDYSCYEHR